MNFLVLRAYGEILLYIWEKRRDDEPRETFLYDKKRENAKEGEDEKAKKWKDEKRKGEKLEKGKKWKGVKIKIRKGESENTFAV